MNLTMHGMNIYYESLGSGMPIFIMVGENEGEGNEPFLLVGYTDSWNYLHNYSRASFVVLDNAGHNLQIEQPELFNCLVRDWLDRVSDFSK